MRILKLPMWQIFLDIYGGQEYLFYKISEMVGRDLSFLILAKLMKAV